MKRLIFLVFILLITSCAYKEDFYNDKKEIMLRSNYQNNTFVSYLGIMDNKDITVIASKFKVKSIKINGEYNNFIKIKKDEFNLPYSSDYLYFYKTNTNASKNNTLEYEIVLENNAIIKDKLQRISKSLNYNL